MKKFTRLLPVLLTGLAFSSMGVAQVNNQIGSIDTSTALGAAECSLLGARADIKLSSGSMLAYKCSPVYNVIKLMTCNTGGSRTPTTINCQWVADPEGSGLWPNDPLTGVAGDWNDPQCTDDFTDDGTPIQVDIVGGKYFTMTTTGGGLSESGGNATDTCSTAVLESVI